jgi:predicted nucleic acid-binding Zn ribbon protein
VKFRFELVFFILETHSEICGCVSTQIRRPGRAKFLPVILLFQLVLNSHFSTFAIRFTHQNVCLTSKSSVENFRHDFFVSSIRPTISASRLLNFPVQSDQISQSHRHCALCSHFIQVVKEGWLEKLGEGLVKSYKRRYFKCVSILHYLTRHQDDSSGTQSNAF